jgi:hypothetical protein
VLILIAVILVCVVVSAIFAWRSMRLRRVPTSEQQDVVRSAHPVLIVNPWSGDGKAENFGLASVAAEMDINTVVLQRGDDLRGLALAAVADGCDVLTG